MIEEKKRDRGKGEIGERENKGGFAVQTELLLALIDLKERERRWMKGKEVKEGRARKEDGLREEEGAKEIGTARTKGERGQRRM